MDQEVFIQGTIAQDLPVGLEGIKLSQEGTVAVLYANLKRSFYLLTRREQFMSNKRGATTKNDQVHCEN